MRQRDPNPKKGVNKRGPSRTHLQAKQALLANIFEDVARMRDEMWKEESLGCAWQAFEQRLVDALGAVPIRVVKPPVKTCGALIETLALI